MTNIFMKAWYRLSGDDARRKVHRSISHPTLGSLEFDGERIRRDESIRGSWSLVPPGFGHRVSVDFRSMDEPLPEEQRSPDPMVDLTPSTEDLGMLASILGDLDGLFERCRPQVSEQYERTVEEPMPPGWRGTLRLDSLQVPAAGVADAEWQVSYWCENALHWFVIDFAGDRVTDVDLAG
jgi:hypothetical protein